MGDQQMPHLFRFKSVTPNNFHDLGHAHAGAGVDQGQFIAAIQQVNVAIVIIGQVKSLPATPNKVNTVGQFHYFLAIFSKLAI
jgi:hypothetical protein